MAQPKLNNIVQDAKWFVENQVLDDEEKEIARDIANGIYVPTENMEQRLAELKLAAQNTLKKKPITVRIQEIDIIRLKMLAGKQGIPYQTLVSSVIHRYVTGQLKGDL